MSAFMCVYVLMALTIGIKKFIVGLVIKHSTNAATSEVSLSRQNILPLMNVIPCFCYSQKKRTVQS